MIGLETSAQDEDTQCVDIESELCGSAREACVAYFPFMNLDLTRVAMEYAQFRDGVARRGQRG
jgi:hypothetical protein